MSVLLSHGVHAHAVSRNGYTILQITTLNDKTCTRSAARHARSTCWWWRVGLRWKHKHKTADKLRFWMLAGTGVQKPCLAFH